MKQRLVLLDAGHGKETKGKRSPKFEDGSQLFEYEFNRDVANRVQKLLEAFKVDAILLVPEENDVSLRERCNRVNEVMAQNPILVSIHANAHGDGNEFTEAGGWEAYTSPGITEADELCACLYRAAEENLGDDFKIRKDAKYPENPSFVGKEEQFYILKHTKCPAVLTENLFMTNKKEAKFLMTEIGRARVAEAIFNGIMYFLA